MTNILLVIIAIYLSIGVYLYITQRSHLYFPTKAVSHNHDTIQISNGGETIEVIVVNPGQKKALLYFGGNAEVVADGAEVFESRLIDHTTYLVEYRGYGHSTGTPTQAGIVSDGLKIYDTISPKHKQISLFGRSIGTGVAMQVASQRVVSQMALITPYDSITALAKKRYPIYPMEWLLKDKYDSFSLAPHIVADTIILIASDDTLVPKKHAYRLESAFAPELVSAIEIADSTHANIADTQQYTELLDEFFHKGE